MPEEAMQILKEIRDTLKEQDKPKMLFVKDVAKIMKMNVSEAGKLWKREDFPGIDIGLMKVEQSAFKKWLQEKRENGDLTR